MLRNSEDTNKINAEIPSVSHEELANLSLAGSDVGNYANLQLLLQKSHYQDAKVIQVLSELVKDKDTASIVSSPTFKRFVENIVTYTDVNAIDNGISLIGLIIKLEFYDLAIQMLSNTNLNVNVPMVYGPAGYSDGSLLHQCLLNNIFPYMVGGLNDKLSSGIRLFHALLNRHDIDLNIEAVYKPKPNFSLASLMMNEALDGVSIPSKPSLSVMHRHQHQHVSLRSASDSIPFRSNPAIKRISFFNSDSSNKRTHQIRNGAIPADTPLNIMSICDIKTAHLSFSPTRFTDSVISLFKHQVVGGLVDKILNREFSSDQSRLKYIPDDVKYLIADCCANVGRRMRG